MAITYNGNAINNVTFNGNELNKVTYNGNTVWEKTTPVQDITLQYGINTNNIDSGYFQINGGSQISSGSGTLTVKPGDTIKMYVKSKYLSTGVNAAGIWVKEVRKAYNSSELYQAETSYTWTVEALSEGKSKLWLQMFGTISASETLARVNITEVA